MNNGHKNIGNPNMRTYMRTSLKQTTTIKQKQKMKPYFIAAIWTISIAAVAGILAFIALNFGHTEKALAGGGAGATFTSTTTGGNWATGGTWTGGSTPANWANNTAVLNGNISLTSTTTAINGFTSITLNNGKSFTSGTSSIANDLTLQNVTFNVVSGSMTVYGNLALSSTALTITSGNLIVTGTLDINSGSTLTVASGGTVTAASFNTSNNSDAILTNNGNVTINGNVSHGGVITNNSTGTMQINGNLVSTGSGSSLYTNNGILNVTGSMTLPNSGKLQNNPGGQILVANSVTVSSNQNLINGTNVSPPLYADLVIEKNLIQSSSGDVLLQKNSRTAVYGNVTDSGGGGTLLTVSNGGQVYINGNIVYTGGGDIITNSNTTNPWGLYVNGTTTNSGGGSTTTVNKASKAVMQSTNAPFYNWVASLVDSPLPIKLLYFKVEETSASGIALTWATATEENFDRFIVERSQDGKTFESITEIKGAGNSKKVLTYGYKDENPSNGKNYYRLKELDLDEKFEYSNVLSADFQGTNSVTLYPNPSNGEFINYSTNFSPQSDDEITVIDLSGAEVIRQRVDEGTGRIEFNFPLKAGAYIVKYTSSNFNSKQRLIVK
jgi:hypothetical protein